MIVFVEYKAANTNVQGKKTDMLVLFPFARCAAILFIHVFLV